MPGYIQLPRPFTFNLGPDPRAKDSPEVVKADRTLTLPAGRHLVVDEVYDHPFTLLAGLRADDEVPAEPAAPAAAPAVEPSIVRGPPIAARGQARARRVVADVDTGEQSEVA